MRVLRLLICVLVTLLAGTPAAAATYTLTPSQDTDVRQNGGGVANCGACTQLSVRNHSTGEYRPLYQFDLSAIPAGSRLVSATLRLWVTGAENSSVGVYRVTQSWSEGTLTWANSGGVSHDASVVATFTPASSGRYYDIDVASLVALWRAGTANNGLILKIGGNNTLATFTSKEWATA
ncbi:MAG: trimeric autotransporter adhesin, partial [Sphingomonadales bacterium]|nr:trimeric autotransporter adhesin [Sphingomonadales bacterium]